MKRPKSFRKSQIVEVLERWLVWERYKINSAQQRTKASIMQNRSHELSIFDWISFRNKITSNKIIFKIVFWDSNWILIYEKAFKSPKRISLLPWSSGGILRNNSIVECCGWKTLKVGGFEKRRKVNKRFFINTILIVSDLS